jgi:hypothetical protein
MYTLLAASQHTQSPPSNGVGIGIIIAVILAIIVVFALLYTFIIKRSRTSKGGVQPPPSETGEPHPQSPPLESIETRS